MITINICVYCSSMGDETPKKVVLWKETEELVCYECRQDLLDQEFVEPYQKEIHNELLTSLFFPELPESLSKLHIREPKLLPNGKVDCSTRTTIH